MTIRCQHCGQTIVVPPATAKAQRLARVGARLWCSKCWMENMPLLQALGMTATVVG